MILDLAGSYILVKDGKERIAGHLPGCNYLDYMAAGLSDPFFGTNENESHDVGHHDYCYERTFELDPEVFKYEHIELVCSGVDTICKVYINDAFAGSMANVFRTYRFDVKALVKEGENTLRMEFEDPYAYIEKEAAKITYRTMISTINHELPSRSSIPATCLRTYKRSSPVPFL